MPAREKSVAHATRRCSAIRPVERGLTRTFAAAQRFRARITCRACGARVSGALERGMVEAVAAAHVRPEDHVPVGDAHTEAALVVFEVVAHVELAEPASEPAFGPGVVQRPRPRPRLRSRSLTRSRSENASPCARAPSRFPAPQCSPRRTPQRASAPAPCSVATHRPMVVPKLAGFEDRHGGSCSAADWCDLRPRRGAPRYAPVSHPFSPGRDGDRGLSSF